MEHADLRARDLIYDWNTHEPAPSRARTVELDDETLRDGLQSPSVFDPPIEQKLELLHLMDALGIQAADIGFAGTSERAQADIVALAVESAHLKLKVNVACRTVLSDIRHAVECAQQSGVAIGIATFIGSSPMRRLSEGWDITALVQRVEETVTFVVREGLECMFVTEDTTRTDPATLRVLYLKAIACGANRLCIADTVGHATTEGASRLVTFVKGIVHESGADVKVDWHGHQDRGLGVANTLAAIEAGADRVHATALGIGERCGNAPMDTLLVNLRLLGMIDSDLMHLGAYVHLASQMTGVPIPVNWPVFGDDAFRTATGVHGAAVSKALGKGDAWLADHVYSSVPADWFGLHQTIEIGPLSGTSNVVYYLKSRNIEPERALVAKILERAKHSARVLKEYEVLSMVNT